MAQTITNLAGLPGDAAFLPAAHASLADQTLVAGALTTATQNTGVPGLKFIRVRGLLKTLGGFGGTDTLRVAAQVGTGAAITNPVTIAQQLLTFETGDTGETFELTGWSNAGFQSYAIIFTCSDGAAVSVIDLIIDCA